MGLNCRCLITTVFMLALLLLPRVCCAGNREALRAWVGIDLFPAVVSADAAITAKTGPDKTLKLILLYLEQEYLAQEMSARLNLIGTIRGIPIQALSSPLPILSQIENPAAIFLVERMGKALPEVLGFGIKHQILIFSPFEGDVEQGVPAGMIITDRILPFINHTSLAHSQITLRPFFLSIAESYQP